MRQQPSTTHDTSPGRPSGTRTPDTLIKSQDVLFRPKFELETPT